MRANGKSTYQIKKEKLQRIKHITERLRLLQIEKLKRQEPWIDAYTEREIIELWEIVKDE